MDSGIGGLPPVGKVQSMDNPIKSAKTYALISGLALGATALLGIVMEFVNKGSLGIDALLKFDWTHDVLHVVLAIAALAAATVSSGSYARVYARIFGAVYLLLGVFGWFSFTNSALKPLGLHLETLENVIHLVIGAWGLAAGFLDDGTTTGTTTRTTTAPRA